MPNFAYIKRFDKIDIFVNDTKLVKKQKNAYLSSINNLDAMRYIGKVRLLSLVKLFKDPVMLFQLPIILLRHITGQKQSEYVNDVLYRNYNNHNKLRIEDKYRNILIERTDILTFYETLLCYHDSILVNQYNLSSEKIKNKIVIDVGANFGEFAIYCSRLGAKKVYAFEPLSSTFKILKKQIKLNNLNGKVIPIKMALGDKNQKLRIRFSKYEDCRATINGKGSNSEAIDVITLDAFCKKEKISEVDFIKIDSEGYEKQVLIGAIKIIASNKPVLSFSAYHKPSDKKILPALVRKIRSDYKIKFLKRAEEDFYCD